MSAAFGERLRGWRTRRGLSQLALAGTAGTTQRHLSFLESGRAAPSRDMVLRLALALDVPLRQQNALLLAAGLAPAWPERQLDAPALAEVERALDFMLAQQEPYPAVVVDRRWTLLRANAAAVRLTTFLLGPVPPSGGSDAQVNLAELLLSPQGLRPVLANWTQVAAYFLRGVAADALADGSEETAALHARLLALPDVPALAQAEPIDEAPSPVLAMHFRKKGTSLRLFTAIATLGTPQDITLQELRVESFFPADDETASLLRSWAARDDQAGN